MQICFRILVAAYIFLNACSHPHLASENGCENHLRALFDVGSGSTKMNVSEVTICKDGKAQVKRVLDDKTDAPLSLEAGKDARGNFTSATQEQALKTLTELRDKALTIARNGAPEYRTLELVAVGTHAVRTAGNSADLVKRVNDLGFTLLPISQQLEGETGFRGARQSGIPAACGDLAIVVWDVGGGSQQLSETDSSGQIHVHPVGFSSEAFRQKLIQITGPRPDSRNCNGGRESPNPIGKNNFSKVENLSHGLAKTALAEFNFDKDKKCLVGIGGVHSKSIEIKIQQNWPQLQKCVCNNSACTHSPQSYTRTELRCLAEFLSRKSDCDPELHGSHSPVAAGNAFLVLGFMEKMNADQISTLHVNMATQLITDTAKLPWTAVKLK